MWGEMGGWAVHVQFDVDEYDKSLADSLASDWGKSSEALGVFVYLFYMLLSYTSGNIIVC